MLELKVVNLTFLIFFTILFYFLILILFLNLRLEFSMISYITITKCHKISHVMITQSHIIEEYRRFQNNNIILHVNGI